jgi:hypothetical protein
MLSLSYPFGLKVLASSTVTTSAPDLTSYWSPPGKGAANPNHLWYLSQSAVDRCDQNSGNKSAGSCVLQYRKGPSHSDNSIGKMATGYIADAYSIRTTSG